LEEEQQIPESFRIRVEEVVEVEDIEAEIEIESDSEYESNEVSVHTVQSTPI